MTSKQFGFQSSCVIVEIRTLLFGFQTAYLSENQTHTISDFRQVQISEIWIFRNSVVYFFGQQCVLFRSSLTQNLQSYISISHFIAMCMRVFHMTHLRWPTKYFVRWLTSTLKMTNLLKTLNLWWSICKAGQVLKLVWA